MIPATNTKVLVAEDWKKIYQSFRNADFKSYDFETLRRTMIQYLQENYPEEFNDFIDSSEYIALIDVIAYLGQNLSFRIDLNARENFLETAQRRDSILRLAQLISYSPTRNIPANGLLKITAVSTSDNVYDSNGTNLANTVISWNDPTNPDWYQQFVNIMNSAMTSNFGNPADRDTITGIYTEQYKINSSNEDVPVFSFNKNINGIPMSFEIVPCTFAGKDFIYEQPPKPADAFSMIYRNDNKGSASENTGFFTHFRQGSISLATFSLDNPVPNEIVGVNTPDINNTDIWLWQLDKNGNFSTLWTQVPALVGNNIIYNSLQNSLRTIYAVSTRDEDQIDLNFADGVFGDLPKGDFRLFYRQSNGLDYVIKPEQLTGIEISVPYLNGLGQSHTLKLTMSLQYTVSNAAGTETNANIQLKAPQAYYLQNRMITGEDYNIGPLTAGTDILKVKSVNRVSSGLSKYFDIKDITGRYSPVDVFASDGILYKNFKEEFFEFEFTNRNQITAIIKNNLSEIVASAAMRSFYYDKYDYYNLSSLSLTWVEVNVTPGQSRGYFNSLAGPTSVGTFSESNLRYSEAGALIKFISPNGKYFDQNNNLKNIPSNNVLPANGKTYIWASVKQIIGDGSNGGIGRLDDGTGPIILGTKVPSGAIPVEVLPKYVSVLGFALENEIVNFCQSQRNFGLTIDNVSRSWSLILNSNVNLTDEFSLSTQNNVEDLGLDSSWLISFTWTGKKYRVRYRTLEYTFESKDQVSFFVDQSSINYDFISNTVIKDKIEVLSVNPQPATNSTWYGGGSNPSSSLGLSGDFYVNTVTNKIFKNESGVWVQSSNLSGQIGTDLVWQIDKAVVESDGYIDPKKVVISFYDNNNTGQISDPDSFERIVGSSFIYFKKQADGLRYNLDETVRDAIETETSWSSYKLNQESLGQPINDGDLFYFYGVNENVVKYWSTLTSSLVYTDEYVGKQGRSDLKFHYVHNSGDDRRVDPSKTNLIDVYVLTVSYDNEYRSWLSGNLDAKPLPPTSQSLETNYRSKLEPIKAISDEIVFHPVKYKVLFGNTAEANLQAVFKAVRNQDRATTDNDIKTRILNAINQFFALENWNFGQTFYFSELSAYVMNSLTPDITNFVIVPKNNNSFGSLYEVACQSDEIFISGVSINDIEVIDGITAAQLKLSNIETGTGS